MNSTHASLRIAEERESRLERTFLHENANKNAPVPKPTRAGLEQSPATAFIYCEGNFAENDGKTANGLVRYSEKYKILAVIDSRKAGLDAGVALGGEPNFIPVCADLAEATARAGGPAEFLIIGLAPSDGKLSPEHRRDILDAIRQGFYIVNGLHEFLNNDPEFVEASSVADIAIWDIRRPPLTADLRIFRDRIDEAACPRIAVLGTDCSIGKRTTATILTHALNDAGISAVLINTGQTGLIQGARYGVALDAIPSQFCPGELEATVLEAFEAETPDVIVIEGQGSLSHPAYSTSSSIIRGCRPAGVILQHAPARKNRCDFAHMPMPALREEINLIETFAGAPVIGITINHENMTDVEIARTMLQYTGEFGVAVTDALSRPPALLVEMVLSAFPELLKTTDLAAV